jgi:formylglycine-generating enzyme
MPSCREPPWSRRSIWTRAWSHSATKTAPTPRPRDRQLYPGADPELLLPGGLVFEKAIGPVDLRDFRSWWSYTPGACWRHPEGPEGSFAHGLDHPVVQIVLEDAEAYAQWAHQQLPT